MSTNTKNEKSVSGDSPVCGKSRGNRLARRARSFKEDFLEIISQMRSPGGSSTRSGSPSSPKTRPKGTDIVEHGTLERNPLKDLEFNILQAQLALKHFRDVINKNKLEMLPGNGTVVLDTISAIHVLLKKFVLNEQSSALVSATNQVYQSLAKLIKLCDDYILIGEVALRKENVTDVVNLVEDAIQNFVTLTKGNLILRDSSHKLGNDVSYNHVNHKPRMVSEKNNLDLGQRSSLPDIPLTPREREILERTSAFVLERHSQSSDNVLDDSPPPKPPHPDRVHLDPSYPPPLPPKKKPKHLDDVVVMKNSMECLSLRSKSPEDSSSLLSASAGSLDSVLSHCGEGELSDLAGQAEGGEIAVNSFCVERNFVENGCPLHLHWSYGTLPVEQIQAADTLGVCDCTRDSLVFVPEAVSQGNSPVKSDRFSGSQPESGFSSMPSVRSSCQSYSASSQHLSSTRSSQQSYTSHDSHLTEKTLTSSSESAHSRKIQYLTVDNNQTQSTSQKEVVNNVLSEKLSYQKQAYFKRCTETSTGNEICRTPSGSPCKKLEDVPCCHHEIKLHECSFHASSLSCSSHEPFGTGKPASPNHGAYGYACGPNHGNSSISSENDKPPALPEKVRSRINRERYLSQYDNLDNTVSTLESSREKSSKSFQTVIENGIISHKQNTMSMMNAVKINSFGGVRNMSQTDSIDTATAESKNCGNTTEQTVQSMTRSVLESVESQCAEGKPPPLPPKKRHIMAYMEIFGNASHASSNEFLRHSVHAYNLLQSEWQYHHKLISSTQSCLFNVNCDSSQTTPVRTNESISRGLPPALPPKKRTRSTTSSPPQTPTLILTSDVTKGDESKSGEQTNIQIPEPSESSNPENGSLPSTPMIVNKELTSVESSTIEVEKDGEVSLLDRLIVSEYLVFKKEEEEGPDIRGGHPDALVIHATKAHKNDFLYQEAFLTTYRTFMTPLELIQKLCYRHQKFSNSQDSLKQRAARESFSLLVRVVSDLTLTDLDKVILQTLMEFVQQLLCRGDLTMAKALRVIMLSKYEAKKQYLNANNLLPSHNIYTRQSLLLDFKSEHIAEQMTLLDAELFLKIEIPEVLIWAQEQNEERSPNLTKFTEHFNKMSYWARSRILEQNDAKDREKYVLKFIKIMKHLRKINNFNSYLALLSALDSAPIRRLEWQKHITEGLKEYCALIDSSSSFRAYRQALAETNPPCIPYIGLVLQDLTFVHIGNMNTLPTGAINFSKRWQQFNIVENMKRFKKGNYPYKKNERIIAFFNGFDDSLSEEAMWQISEKIKPRGGKKN